jgi:uncharacterized protein GlcG (DUF336 family)
MVDAAVAKARELGVGENVAILDDGGNLKAFIYLRRHSPLRDVPSISCASSLATCAIVRRNSLRLASTCFPGCHGKTTRATTGHPRRGVPNLIGGRCLKSCQLESAQDAGEEDALELGHRGGIPLAFREKDRSLQRRQDEVTDFLAIEVLRKFSGFHCLLQAGRE